jgi:hypothetical protein
MKHYWILSLMFIGISCGGDGSVAEAPKKVGSAAAPSVTLYMVSVDNLQLRDKPDMAGSVVLEKFNKGALLWGTGEVSDHLVEATSQEIPMKEPFVRVKQGAAAGWLFRGALVPLYIGPRATEPDSAMVNTFSGFLAGLDTKDLRNGGKAWGFVENNFSTASGSLGDALYILLHYFLRRMEITGSFYTLTEEVPWEESDYSAIASHQFDLQKYAQTRQLASNGFQLVVGEGQIFPTVDASRLSRFFSSKVTPAMSAFLRLSEEEHTKASMDDNGLIVPIDLIAQRAVAWEKFNRDFPDFVMQVETREHARWNSFTLINGADNTPVFNYEDLKINPAFRAAWEKLVEEHPQSEVAKTLQSLLSLCEAEQWTRTNRVKAWLEAYAERVYPNSEVH